MLKNVKILLDKNTEIIYNTDIVIKGKVYGKQQFDDDRRSGGLFEGYPSDDL